MFSHPAKRQDYDSDYDFFGAASDRFEHFDHAAAQEEAKAAPPPPPPPSGGKGKGGKGGMGGGGGGGGQGGGGKIGYSAGSGLRSIAQGSADQANNAVLNQHIAAQQAAYVAKNTLAQSAAGVRSQFIFYTKIKIIFY